MTCNFKSALSNNMNTSVFQYYIKMTGYTDPTAGTGGTLEDKEKERLADKFSS